MSLVIFVSDNTSQISCHICQTASVIIGRAPESDVRLDHPSVSKAHCRVDRVNGLISVTDLGSSNGVFVNGLRRENDHVIEPTDLIQIMDFSLMVRSLNTDEAKRFEAGQDPMCVAPAPLLELKRLLEAKASEPNPIGHEPSSLNSIFDAVTPTPSEVAPLGRQPSSLNSIFDAVTPAQEEPAPTKRQPSSLNSIFDAVTPSSTPQIASPKNEDEG